MLNALTIDIEDYFQVQAFSDVIRFEDWAKYECRVERNTHRLLEILNECIGPNNSINSMNSTNSSNSINPSNPSAALQHGSTAAPCSPRATFFILGWIAERYPNLIRRIKGHGHEIACHGYAHKVIYNQTKEEFRSDIRKAKAVLEDITGDEVIGYRAPSYSITNKSPWAFEILKEEGFKYDSSIFPIHHDFYGFPEAPRFPFLISLNGNNNFGFQTLNFKFGSIKEPQHSITAAQQHFINASPQHRSIASLQHSNTPNSELPAPNCLLEFPLSTVQLLGINFPISGGGYFRLFPYSLVRKGLRKINEEERKPFIFYVHPWELDAEQPRIKDVGLRSKFRHYINLNKTEGKFKKLLGNFQFSTIQELLGQINLNNVNDLCTINIK
jgi:polysaccharide deacetylase family protein (PEP-CTERM system associated)